MIAKQFQTKSIARVDSNHRKSPTVLSPSVIGTKGLQSARKRRAAQIIHAAILQEEDGDIEKAMELCEDAFAVYPDSEIMTKITLLRTKQQQKHKLQLTGTRKAGIVSDADIVSATIKKASSGKILRPILKEVPNTNAVIKQSMASMNVKQKEAAAVSPEVERGRDQNEDFDDTFQSGYPSPEGGAVCTMGTDAADPHKTTEPAVMTRQEASNILKAKVSQIINLQLLDVLNNGSADELLGLHLIGKKRAQYIMELREEGFIFHSLADLSMISFTPKTIRTFKELNIPLAVGMF